MSRLITFFRPYARILLAIWLLLIIIFAVLPDLPMPRLARGKMDIRLDYPIHYLEHTGLAILAMISFITTSFKGQRRRFITILLLLIMFAIFAEMLQLLIPARSFELSDMGLNILGSLTGTFITWLIYQKG